MDMHQHGTMSDGPGSHSGFGNRFVDFFTGGGEYMPRVHCMVNEAGQTDWAWVWILAILNLTVIAGYIRIFWFWRRAYHETEARDRNDKLMNLAWIFLWCAVCGYVASVVMFFWPAYRLVAFCLMPLAFFTWKFAANLEPFRISLSAKRLERELAESLQERNEELERTVAERTLELERALRRADRANESKTNFLANMSHEIRTPMNAIVGFADMLEEDRANPEIHAEHVQTIRRNSTHLLSLINDVLDISKVEAGKLDVEQVPTDIRQVLNDVHSLFLNRARAKSLELVMDIEDSTPQCVLSDPTRFRQIISNLVSNAIKFTSTGRVIVRVRYKDRQLSVSVHDTGPGIDEETLGRLFRSFTQADASITRTHGGTGLGLKISRDLAVLMGGDLAVESKLGEGSMFWLRLPAEVIQPVREQTIAPVEQDAVPLRGARVLVVEDGEDNARLATFSLERAGAEVERACHGQEAVDLVRSGAEFDVILMDIQMPIMDGYEATRILREEGCTTPIIAATASVLLADREQCIDAGCDGFLPKPYKRAELVEQCRSMIGRSDQGQAA